MNQNKIIIKKLEIKDIVRLQSNDPLTIPMHYKLINVVNLLKKYNFSYCMINGGDITGYIIMTLIDSNAEIISMKCDEKNSEKLLNYAILKLYKFLPVIEVYIHTQKENIKTYFLYKKFGFQYIKTIPNFYTGGGTAYRMCYDLEDLK